MDKRKVIYYTDELNEEFSTAVITPKKIDGNYKYCNDSPFRRFTAFFWYRIIATPAAFIYMKTVFRRRVYGKEKLEQFKGKGYFLFGNHTQDIGDALNPSTLNFPQKNYCIVHANNVSMPYLGRVTPSMGAIPIPDGIDAYKNFRDCIKRRVDEGHTVVIYPEAHIWPYYTGIRPFGDTSFQYPIELSAPVFCFTNTYQHRGKSKNPRMVTYIDGPFYADPSLPKRKQRTDLRNKVYECMKERAKNSDMECIQYIKSDSSND